MKWRQNEDNGIHFIDLSKNGYNSYMYLKDDSGIDILRKYTSTEEYKKNVREVIENEIYDQSTALDKYLQNIATKIRNNRRNNVSSTGSKRGGQIIGQNTRNVGKQGRNNGTENIKNSVTNVENSNKSSFYRM